MNHKLEVINTLYVVDFDTVDGAISYVAIENTIENEAILRAIGATPDDFTNMKMEDGLLDVAFFAFTKCGATNFSTMEGFGNDND